MTEFDWIIVTLTTLSVLIIPAIFLMIRLTIKWTNAENRIANLADDIKELVENKDKVHSEMLAQMREDRSVTDRRLRWLEENLWRNRPPRNTGTGGKHAL